MKTHKISVVVTAYDHEEYIAQCLDSILIQKGTFDLEVVLGDDCSTDRTPQIMEEYAEKHPGTFILLPPTANMGVTKNIKRCLDACSGDYIAFCEGDDYWIDRYKLQKQMEFLESHPGYSMCFNAIMLYYENEKGYLPHTEQFRLDKDTLTIDDLIEFNVIGNFSCCMYRTDTVHKLPAKLFDIYTLDWMFNMVCSRLGKIGFIRNWMSVYRIRPHGVWSGKSRADQRQAMLAAIDSYNQFFNYEYHDQFHKLKNKIAVQYGDNPNREVPFWKRYGGLLIRAITHPRKACNSLLRALSVAFAELTAAAVSAKDAQIAKLCSTLQSKDGQVAVLSTQTAELSSTVRTQDARIAVLRSLVQVKEVDLLILDTLFPHPLSRFRLEEFRAYLRQFKNSMVLSSGEHLPLVKETKSLDIIIGEFESLHPELRGRTKVTTYDIDGYNAKLACLIFLNNVTYFLESLEEKKIPFVFTLYPGGGFEIDQEGSDSLLRRIFNSAQFRKVIVTQQITYDYLVKNNFCPEDKTVYIYGGVMPLDILNKSEGYRKKCFGFEKDSLDICFVAVKYMPMGIDKGYDVFIEVAKKLAQLHSNINFHVVGNFTEADIPVNGLEERLTFYGFQELDWFDKFYMDKDIILSPNVPFVLLKGAFDGFPTTSCVEAGLRKVAVFCTDELKLNNHFIDNEEIVIIPHDTDGIAQIIEAFYKEPDKLRSVAEKGAAKMREVFSYERQILSRVKLIESEMHTLWK